jgi:hypothetical protein
MAIESGRAVYTRTGRAYMLVTNCVAVLAVLWLATDPFEWVPAIDYFTVRGALFLAAVLLGLMIAFAALAMLFALLALVLEKLGVKLTRPA